MDKKVTDAIMKGLSKLHEDRQNAENQYIVVYKKKSDDSVLGYHASTFCQLTKEALRAKRYSGDNPDAQLKIIWKNFQYMVKSQESNDGNFVNILSTNTKRTDWEGIDFDDVYIDVEYLSEGTPKQDFSVVLINPKNEV